MHKNLAPNNLGFLPKYMHLSLFYHTDYCTDLKLPKEKAMSLGIRSTLAKEQFLRFHLFFEKKGI